MKSNIYIVIIIAIFACISLKSFSQANTTLSNLVSPTSINQDLKPKSNSTLNLGSAAKSWRMLYIDSSIYLKDSLFMHNTGTRNAFVGESAGYFITTGSNNAAVGCQSLYNNKSGSYNSAFGNSALLKNRASYNSAFGNSALGLNTTGVNNSAVGALALFKNSTGSNNAALGYQALYSNTTAGSNTAIGYQALYSNTTAAPNTAVGSSALYSNTTGIENTAIGASALYYNTTGNYNIAVGRGALFQNTVGINNTAIGFKALFSSTEGIENTANGSLVMAFNATGSGNTGSGYAALYSNIDGEDNNAFGDKALYSNTSGNYNTAAGLNALSANTIGSENVANGDYALSTNLTGNGNVANGDYALSTNLTGNGNVANGDYALSINSTGSDNTAVGHNADVSLSNSNYNTIIGAAAQINGSNSVVIGFGAYTNTTNLALLGSTTTAFCGGYANWTNYASDRRLKTDVKENVKGLEFINRLRPVTYHLDLERLYKIQGISRYGKQEDKMSAAMKTDIDKNIHDKEAVLRSGFIAQEVEEAAQESGYDFDGVKKPQNDKDNYGLSYATFVVPLVKAVQELDAKNTELENEVQVLKQMVQQLMQNKSPGSSSSWLSQSIPNPTQGSTIIPYQVAKGSHTAMIQITQTGSGKVLKTIPLDVNATQVSFNAGLLAAGSYMYVLIVDGKQADSRQMLLSE